MDTVNISALNSTSFVFSRVLTPWASVYNLSAAQFRAMMRLTATDPVVQYEWSTAAGTITFAESMANGYVDYVSNPVNGDTLTLGSSQVLFSNAGTQVVVAPSSVVTITDASPAVVSWTAHGLPAGTPVVFSTTGALPTGLVAGTVYFISITGLATNSFSVADTFAHALAGVDNINTSSAGSGVQTATASSTIAWAASGLSNNATVSFTSTGNLPAPLVSGQIYFVSPTLNETNTFEIATVPNGTPLIFGGPQSGTPHGFSGNTVPIGLTVGNTLANLSSLLQNSTDPQISQCIYNVSGDELSIIFHNNSILGNLFALSASSQGAVVSAPTLYGAGGVITFTAPLADIAIFDGTYVYDCRLELGTPVPTTVVQIFGGTITFSEGVTR